MDGFTNSFIITTRMPLFLIWAEGSKIAFDRQLLKLSLCTKEEKRERQPAILKRWPKKILS